MKKKQIDAIVEQVANKFRCFGGGRGNASNPMTHWTKDEPPMFALGVDVRMVVDYVVKEVEKSQRQARP